jgi:hypothetical protein
MKKIKYIPEATIKHEHIFRISILAKPCLSRKKNFSNASS